MVRELPKVTVGKTEYYLDERLCELRAVNNPHAVIRLTPVEAALMRIDNARAKTNPSAN